MPSSVCSLSNHAAPYVMLNVTIVIASVRTAASYASCVPANPIVASEPPKKD